MLLTGAGGEFVVQGMSPGAQEQLIKNLPCWQGPVQLTPLKGGVSNVSYKAVSAQGSHVVRLGRDYPFHQVFRDTELAASLAAQEAGLSPAVTYAAPGVMVVEFLEARTYGESDVRDNLVRCLDIVKRCHHEMGKRVRGRIGFFWVFQVIRSYLHQLKDAGHAQAAHAAGWAAVVDRLEAAQEPLPIVFGHHDLLPTNFLDDGQRLWLIDWEYGGFGTAMFDLANISANNQLSEAQDSALLEGYFERRPGEGIERSFAAMRCASALREATWGMVSEINLPETGIDYPAYASEYLGRYQSALAAFEDRFGKR